MTTKEVHELTITERPQESWGWCISRGSLLVLAGRR